MVDLRSGFTTDLPISSQPADTMATPFQPELHAHESTPPTPSNSQSQIDTLTAAIGSLVTGMMAQSQALDRLGQNMSQGFSDIRATLEERSRHSSRAHSRVQSQDEGERSRERTLGSTPHIGEILRGEPPRIDPAGRVHGIPEFPRAPERPREPRRPGSPPALEEEPLRYDHRGYPLHIDRGNQRPRADREGAPPFRDVNTIDHPPPR